MKVVVAGSKRDFDRFLEVLWRKDKDISQYKYVDTELHLRGMSADGNEIVKLSSFNARPDKEVFEDAIRERGFDTSRRSRSRRPAFRNVMSYMSYYDEQPVRNNVWARSGDSLNISGSWTAPSSGSYGFTMSTPERPLLAVPTVTIGDGVNHGITHIAAHQDAFTRATTNHIREASHRLNMNAAYLNSEEMYMTPTQQDRLANLIGENNED